MNIFIRILLFLGISFYEMTHTTWNSNATNPLHWKDNHIIRTENIIAYSYQKTQLKPKLQKATIVRNHKKQQPIVKQRLVFQDDFSRKELGENWVTEWDKANGSSVYIKDEKLWVDTQGGISVWLNQKLPQNVRIECTRNVVVEGKPNDRLSDLNFFWSCQDPKFERKSDGNFATYDSLALYYVGIGGNYNSTTRLRKYDGRGERVLWQEKNDKAHLLTENTVYTMVLEVRKGQVSVWVNGELYFTQKDPNPLGGGYFAIRSTKSRQWIDDIKIYELLD
ncbi:DUF6250 domain-containing protein [Flectobacillus longus]|uniref:DUF6250 domain-containing protein n=1 Tax=Flectobacillus longus TaxID=2984207 RepID=UPI0024B836A9|nr:DUF6250 domain-containing protein [Flectobacillus longus]MDI9881586.1 DUF6250 domain-containing protein [Flectobacillus longus]